MQETTTLSFVGGQPIIPKSIGLPSCLLCASPMAFYFQITFPAGHSWSNHVLALFSCVCCSKEGTFIPQMITGPVVKARIPEGFLSSYQTNFRFVVAHSSECILRTDYSPSLHYVPLDTFKALRVGGMPRWLLDDETPQSYGALRMPAFLGQLSGHVQFTMLPSAKPQRILDLSGEVVDSPDAYYELFLGNNIYLFGFGSPSSGHVYVLTQR